MCVQAGYLILAYTLYFGKMRNIEKYVAKTVFRSFK